MAAAWENAELVGLARVVSDGHTKEPGQKAFYEALGYRQAGADAADGDGGLSLRAFVRFDG